MCGRGGGGGLVSQLVSLFVCLLVSYPSLQKKSKNKHKKKRFLKKRQKIKIKETLS